MKIGNLLNPRNWFSTEQEIIIRGIRNDKSLTPLQRDIKICRCMYSGVELERAILSVKLEHAVIDDYMYEVEDAKLVFSGEILDMMLLDIDKKHKKINDYEYDVIKANHQFKLVPEALEKALIEVSLKHGKITQQHAEEKLVELLPEGVDKKLKLLDVQHKYRKINDNEYNKQKATLLGESFVCVVKVDLDEDGTGSFELDWNDLFIKELREAGLKGKTDEDIASQWLDSICRSIALDAFSGVGDFEEKLSEIQYIKTEKK